MAQEDLRKKVDLAFLSAFYGGLLTEKQRRVLSLHCEEDLSLGEIAADVGISRQAVHETISRAASRLNELEASSVWPAVSARWSPASRKRSPR